MSYYIAKTLREPFEEAIAAVTSALKAEGFGVLTDIDVQATLKSKLGVAWRPYRILGACNPQFAYQALQTEDKIGVMLPCNVILQQLEDGTVEVAAVDPTASMSGVGKSTLFKLSETVRGKLEAVLERL